MRRSLMLCAAWVLSMSACSTAESPKPPAREPQQAASTALGVLQQFVTASNYQAMGFASAGEVKGAQLGSPLNLYNIGLDALRSYETSTDVNKLLVLSNESVYPVTVGGEVKSSVSIVKLENGYQVSSFGNAKAIASLARFRQAAPSDEFIVRVPALNIQFLGRRLEGRVLLVPTMEDSRLKVAVGEAVPLDVVLGQLVPLAKAYNGLPM